jgi:hypothetical protein
MKENTLPFLPFCLKQGVASAISQPIYEVITAGITLWRPTDQTHDPETTVGVPRSLFAVLLYRSGEVLRRRFSRS